MNEAIFLSGVCMATFAASGVFFLKFWKAAHDRFYLFFCIACWLLASERIALLMIEAAQYPFRSEETETNSSVYFLRLAAFIFIVLAIVIKNRSTKRPK